MAGEEGDAILQIVHIQDASRRGEIEQAGFSGAIHGTRLLWFDGRQSEPYFDEPEERIEMGARKEWEGFLADLTRTGERAVLSYWDIAKAKRLGAWRPDVASAIVLNWYPYDRHIPAVGRWAYLLWKCAEYRLRHAVPGLRVYGAMQGFAGSDPPSEYYWPSMRQLRWAARVWPMMLGEAFAGFAWFLWDGWPDCLSKHPESWPVNIRTESRRI